MVDRRSLVGNHDAANHNGPAIVDEDLGLGRLRIQAGLPLHANAFVNLGILNVDVQEDRPFGRDLGSNLQFQNGVHVLRGNRVIDIGLDRDLLTLFHRQFLVVLRDALGLREYLADSAVLHQAKYKVDRVVVALGGKGEAAVRSGRSQV